MGTRGEKIHVSLPMMLSSLINVRTRTRKKSPCKDLFMLLLHSYDEQQKCSKEWEFSFSKATSFLQALMPKLSYEKCRLEFDKTSWKKEILCH